MHGSLKKYGVRRGEVERALIKAEAALDRFRARIREAGREAMAKLDATGEPAVLLVGRPYNLFDPVVNIDIPRKLRDVYGVNVLPLEFLAADDADIEAINGNMFWSYGRKILAAAREAGRHERLHLIYLTNFKCGPDSYIKQFVREAFGQPFLTLQFDGHANDAGMLTRVEAFLDSQGILRRWAHQPRSTPWVGDETNLPAVPSLGVAPIAAGCTCSAGCAEAMFCAQPRPAEAARPETR